MKKNRFGKDFVGIETIVPRFYRQVRLLDGLGKRMFLSHLGDVSIPE